MADSIRPTGCLLIFSTSQLEAMKDGQFTSISSNKVMLSYSDSGTTVSKAFAMDSRTFLVELRHALQIRDPNRYGARDTVRVYNGLWTFRGL
jgi:hypothetical protein